MAWTWFRTKSSPPIADDGLDRYGRIAPYDRFNGRLNVFGPYRRPIMDATGRGGQIVLRQFRPLQPNIVYPQQWVPVAITGKGSELTGAFTTTGLVDVTSNNSRNKVV